MKKQSKTLISILMICFMVFTIIPSIFIIPSITQTSNNNNFYTEDYQEPDPKPSQFAQRTIRVAIYNEPNISLTPHFWGIGSNNLTDTLVAMNSAGYQVSQLTTNDIHDHKLKTVDYDVFIMVNNIPKINIDEYVEEFWLGGGGLLSFNTSICFLCYRGILPPNSLGDHGDKTYWEAMPGKSEIYQRHPITKRYEVGDAFTLTECGTTYDWLALQSTSIASDLVRLATLSTNTNDVTVLGFDPSNRGGRVVHMPWVNGEIPSNMTNLVVDAVEWLCPRPKGRILFDLSHHPYYGIDEWDKPYTVWNRENTLYRNYLVNRSYTLDKLYPSTSGNLITNNLVPYDMLIITLPSLNFTNTEVTTVSNWIYNGGSLLVLGENPNPSLLDYLKNINQLLSLFDLSMNLTEEGTSTIDYTFQHPTIEGCFQLWANALGLVNYSGSAYPIWGNNHYDIAVAAQEYGNGRVILTSDVNFLNDNLKIDDNLQFGINIVNWLTASQATVLLYGTDFLPPNYYVTSVANALNELDLRFYLTKSFDYFNLSLHQYSWDLAIVDNPTAGVTTTHCDEIEDFVESGNRLIMSTYRVDNLQTHSLWAELGFAYAADMPDKSPIYIWDPSHSIFTAPAFYGANNYTPFYDYNDEGDLLTVYSNATALAGDTSDNQAGHANIIARNDGRTLFNGYLIDQFSGDIDDSTYDDSFELWLNEIAYMTYQSLSVNILDPHTDEVFNATAPSYSITTDGIIIDETYYTLNDAGHYPITSASGTINQGVWDALSDGTISLKVYVEDTAGSFKYDAVNIDKDTQAPIIEILSPTSGQTFNETAPEFIVNITDDHLDKMWYTIDAGLTNFTFIANGLINQAAWDNTTEGSVTLRFYANDTLGHEAFKQVSITYELPPSGGGRRILSYNGYLIIGVISVISVLFLEKKLKRLKFIN